MLTYDFNGAISANLSAAGILFHAYDLLCCLDKVISNGHVGPVFFVAHSWGGIIVKKAVRLAWEHPRFGQIKESLAGLFFLGTPHVHHDMSIILQAVRNTVAVFRDEEDEICESDIRLYATAVRQINEYFSKARPPDLLISSFWETVSTVVETGNDFLVSRS